MNWVPVEPVPMTTASRSMDGVSVIKGAASFWLSWCTGLYPGSAAEPSPGDANWASEQHRCRDVERSVPSLGARETARRLFPQVSGLPTHPGASPGHLNRPDNRGEVR
jgi:hypothetical protein